jgi:predicted permease
MKQMLGDLRVGLRLLLRDRTFALASAATLALCIAANVVLFSIVEHVLLEPLPWPGASRLVLMGNQYPGAGVCCGTSSGVPDYFDRLRDITAFDEQAMYTWSNLTIDQNGSPARVLAMSVTPSWFRVLSSSPALGRPFTDAEGEVGHEHEVVLSYGLWQSAFGGDPGIVGRDVRLSGQAYTVVGVMPRTFSFLDGNTPDRVVGMWRPLAFTPQQKSDDSRHSNSWQHIARLEPGATIQQAQEQINALNARNLERFPQFKDLLINARFRTDVVGLNDNLVRDVKPTLYWLWGGAFFVLLIGVVNVANLLLVRTSARLSELVTRIALGSGHWRIVRQLVTENILLTLIASAAGVAIGFASLRLLSVFNLLNLPRGNEIHIDPAVGAYAVAIAVAAGVALAIVPLAHLMGANMAAVLTEHGRSGTSGRATRLLRRGFVVVQVAFAFVLLAGAGLLFASFRHVLAIDPGFDPGHVLTATVGLPQARYGDDASLRGFTVQALARLRALPGATAVGATDTIPFGSNNSDSVILAEGYQMQPGESMISAGSVAVTAGYFQTIGAHLSRGRFFDGRDGADNLKTVIVDESLARHFWPNQDPIGRRMYRPTDMKNVLAVTPQTVFFTVVGVIRDLKLASLVEENATVGATFFPMEQQPRRAIVFALKTPVDPLSLAGQVRAAIGDIDRELAVYNVMTLTDRVDRSLATRRSTMLLATVFGALALVLSAIGVYGVLAYLVTQRTKEIGIRIALGSSASAVFQLVLRDALALIGVGFVVGVAGVLALKRSLDSMLVGVTGADPLVLAVAAMALAAVAVAAGVIPARRATRINPVVALTK